MEVPVVKLAEKFGIRPKQIHKSKGKYILTSGKEKFILGKSYETCENIIFQNIVMKAVQEKGFENINEFYLSQEGEPFVIQDGETYVLNRFYDYEEIDFSDEIIIGKIIRELFGFHKIADEINISHGDFISENMFSKIDYAENLMWKIRKKILQNKKISDFDFKFLKNYEYYKGNIIKCKETLEENNYLKLYADGISKKNIALNRIKKDSFKLFKGKIIFTDFSSCSIGVQANDLALLILRYLKFSEKPHLSLEEIAGIYDGNVNREFLNILLAHIIYPESYLKNIQLFYSKKRAWVPGSFTNKMESISQLNKKMDCFIRKLY